MFKHYLANKNGTPLDVHDGLDDHPVLIAESRRVLNAHWKSSAITTATTTTVVSTKPNESILLTDLIIVLSKKVAASTIVAQFSDGTNTANLFTLDSTVDSFQFAHAFQGGLRGWKDADFQIVTNEATTLSVLVGYVHISSKSTKAYAVWDDER